ncbi:ATP-binding protein [Cohnella pontilimi]|uniref:histidine kinase n=1 Tax=Cohnella pontilimi TaxID=2564100 RepID=A0A4U0FHR3_9BACL|nr:sensor histidine kinase [Cohnella pontilimi]TJY44501.1 ATP-binding protein [Cohnella pontilimi]
MIFVLIALWTVAGFLLASDPRSAASRRLAAVSFFGGAGALAAVIDEQIIPGLLSAYPNRHETAEKVLYAIQAVSSVSSYYGVPYTFALFAAAYRPVRLPNRLNRWLPFILFVPIAACLLFTPWYTEMYPISFRIVVWWAVPYLLASSLLIVTKKSAYRRFERTHAIVCLAVLPPVLFFMVMNYVLPSLGQLRMWVYNTAFVGVGFGVFLIGLFTYGFMGVRLAVDRRRMDSTLRAVTSGTAILNHAIKNDIGKMRLFGEKIKTFAKSTDQLELEQDIQTMLSSAAHIQEMISRVHQRTEDLALRPETADLGGVIQETLRSFGPRLGDVQLRTFVPEDWRCRIDAVQLGEAIHNIVSNALEAMGEKGELIVRLSENKREFRIEIEDNGPGMDKKQIAGALEPFYSTKAGTGTNFGLGLPYAYHVMRKHRGTLMIRSAKGVGTTVCLVLPKRAVLADRKQRTTARGGDADVGNTGVDRGG